MKTITVKGSKFQIPTAEEAGIVAGYTLDAAAAKHLYQTRCDRIRNNVTPVVKKLMDQGASNEDIAHKVWDYASNYQFSMPGQRGRVSDPAVKEQYVIARQLLRDHLKDQGRKLSDIPNGMSKEEWKEKVKDNLEKVANHPETVELARKRIQARSASAPSTPAALEGINLS